MSRRSKWLFVESVTDLNGNPKTEYPYEGLRGFLGYFPHIEEGCIMEIHYPSDPVVRLTSTRVKEYTYDKKAQLHTVRTKNSIYTLKDYFDPKARKRATAHLYMKYPIGKRYTEAEPDPEGNLLAYGRYRTKIQEQDLPDWYITGYMYKSYGFMSAKGVKHLVYLPNYHFDHLYKDDFLFISYKEEITPYEEDGGRTWYKGYDELLSGPVIVEFARAVGEFSDFDVADILAEMKKKEEWYLEKFEEWK